MPEFTSSQQHAIAYRMQDACVVAGPGSGKTTVLVERYRALIEEHDFDPREILAITFTEKAAANMKAKLAELFAHDRLRLRELESAWVSTIHGFCARLLRENAIAAGIDPRFSVLDARESEDLQYACMNAALDEIVKQRRPEALQLIEHLHTPAQLAQHLQGVYDAMRSAGKSICEVRAMPNPATQPDTRQMATHLRKLVDNWPANLTPTRRKQHGEILQWAQSLEDSDANCLGDFVRLVNGCPINLGRVPESEKVALKQFREQLPALIAGAVDRHTARFRAMIFDILTRFEVLYNESKRARASVDFNDLERHTIDLLRAHESIRAGIRSQFRQVMLDEFQDINEQQAELIDLVRGKDVFFGVGDTNQSIYGFRHARPEIFRKYRSEIEASGKHLSELLDNFRSRTEILHCVETLLNSAQGIEERRLVSRSAFSVKSEPSIEVLKIHADPANDTDEAALKEARWIAHRILTLRQTLQLGATAEPRLAGFSDFAVLCRNGESMKPILEAFDEARIPYVSGRRQSFLLSREGRDITALLRTIANPRDGISLVTVLRSGLVGLGDEALLRVRLMAGSVPGGLNVIAHDHSRLSEFTLEEGAKLRRFVQNLQRWRLDRDVAPLEVLIVRALTDCGLQWLPETVAGENIESFLRVARARNSDSGIAEFLNEIESLQNSNNLESDLSDKDQGNRVQVMTAHSAKGLEFPVTIIAAMDKGTQKSSAPATFTPAFGLGLKWKDPSGTSGNSGLKDSWQLRNKEHLSERDCDEAHRLLYVAMTRAQEHLILSYSRTRNRPSGWAEIVDRLFQLDGRAVSAEPQIDTIVAAAGDSFDAWIQVTDKEPVPLSSPEEFDPADQAAAIPRPAIEERHDSAVNVTSLALFANCPRKYYLQRYLGWGAGESPARSAPGDLPRFEDLPRREPSKESASEVGSMVHEILAGKPGAFPEEPQRLAKVFLQSQLGARAAVAEKSGREWDFIIDIGGTLVRGSIDLWFEEDGAIHVVDYKTDAVNAAETGKRALDYTPQLALYGLALQRAFGKRPQHAWLHFLRPDKVIEIPLDDSASKRVEDLLAELRAAQDGFRFDLREGEHCRSCAFYREMCPAGA